MKRSRLLLFGAVLCAGMAALGAGGLRADGRPGSVEWSDGRKIEGAISLSPGKDLRIFTNNAQTSLQLDEVKEMRFKPEKEEMWEGYYFPTAGQTTQAKTGEVYPIRQLQTDITLSDGKVLSGHLVTTTLYVETDDTTEKVVLLAKQTGTNGQKLSDLPYPTTIRFDAGAPSAGSSQIDLTRAGLSDPHPPVVVAMPDLGLLPLQPTTGKPIWIVPVADPARLFFSVEAGDGIHVAWPDREADPAVRQAVEASLKVMQEFYDTRTLLGCYADADDVYSLVMMKRMGPTYTYSADKKPWSLAILRWKYNPDEKRTTLLNRAMLAIGRIEGNSQPPTVFKQAELLRDISAIPAPAPAPAPEGTHP
jgi:hypothetical protein